MVAASLPTVTVAVLDTGIAANPQLLTPYLLPGRNFSDSDPTNPADTTDRHFHGTHVAGTIGASVQATGVDGVAAGVRLLPVKVLDDSGSGYTSDIASGIIWAADHGADVINMSSADPATIPRWSPDRLRPEQGRRRGRGRGQRRAERQPGGLPGRELRGRGSRPPTATTPGRPSPSTGRRSRYAAPGVDVASLYLTSGYATASGTSMATPHVAAIAAELKAVDHAFGPDEVASLIEGSAVDLGTPGRDPYFGYGRVDALAAVTAGMAAAGQPTAIDALYQRLGGASGLLGAATSGEYAVAGGTARNYSSGTILLAPGATAAHYVSGPIAGRYAALGGAGGGLQFPADDPVCGSPTAAATSSSRAASSSGPRPPAPRSSPAPSVAVRRLRLAHGALGSPPPPPSAGSASGGCCQFFQGGVASGPPPPARRPSPAPSATPTPPPAGTPEPWAIPPAGRSAGSATTAASSSSRAASPWSPATGAQIVTGAIRSSRRNGLAHRSPRLPRQRGGLRAGGRGCFQFFQGGVASGPPPPAPRPSPAPSARRRRLGLAHRNPRLPRQRGGLRAGGRGLLPVLPGRRRLWSPATGAQTRHRRHPQPVRSPRLAPQPARLPDLGDLRRARRSGPELPARHHHLDLEERPDIDLLPPLTRIPGRVPRWGVTGRDSACA